MPKVRIDIRDFEIVGVPASALKEGEVFIWDDDVIGLRVFDGAITVAMDYEEVDGDVVSIYSEDELEDFENVVPRPDLRARLVFERR